VGGNMKKTEESMELEDLSDSEREYLKRVHSLDAD
jgi:hypothetical protein